MELNSNFSEMKLKLIIDLYKKQYIDMDMTGMCKVFAINIHDSLEKAGIISKISNLKKEFSLCEHEVVICMAPEYDKIRYYLIDFTFLQFLQTKIAESFEFINNITFFNKLLENRFVEVDNSTIQLYLSLFGFHNSFDLKDFFQKKTNLKK